MSPKHIGAEAFLSLVEDPDCFKFTLVRDPYARAVSCYRDKFSQVPIGDGSYVSEICLAWAKLSGTSLDVGTPISFETFCELSADTAKCCVDGHWGLQSQLVPSEAMRPDFVGKFENLTDDLLHVLDRISAEPAVRDYVLSKHREPSGRDAYADALTPETRAKIADTYREDFERFDYPI